MKFIETIEKTGKIPTYHVEEDISNLVYDLNKPSSRIVQTEIGIKTIALLKKIQRDNNHSWYKEVKNRCQKDPKKVALFYRANKITYEEMFKRADSLAKSLYKYGIRKGDEIPCCLANTPELVYIMLAANKIGAKLNMIGSHFNAEYMRDILLFTNSRLFIGTDDEYRKISHIVERVDFENKLIVSLTDSLPENPEECDEYEPELDKYYHYTNFVPEMKEDDPSILSFDEFIEYGKDFEEEIIDDNDLDTEFITTYTSGSTRIGFPKPLLHANKSFIVGGIYNDTNLTGSPEVPEIRGLAHIHTDSNTNLVTCVSDNLIKHGTVALEPEYDKNKMLDYVFLNKPVHLDATTSFLVAMAKDYLINKKFYGRKLPQMLVTMAVGEPTSPGEEKFINTFLRKTQAGSGISLNGIKLLFGPLSIGGGDCEHGGIYYTLLKKIQALAKFAKLGKEEYGMTPVPFAVVTALKKMPDGTYVECDYDEEGMIVANSITTMVGYNNNPDRTKEKIIRDCYGRDWVSCDVYGYINKIGNVIVHGRIEDKLRLSDNNKIPCYLFSDCALKDTKNIMSCSTVAVEKDGVEVPVLSIEFSPFLKSGKIKVLQSLQKRLEKEFPQCPEFYYRIIDSKDSYELSGSGKRNVVYLQKLGLLNTVSFEDGNLVRTIINPENLTFGQKKL